MARLCTLMALLLALAIPLHAANVGNWVSSGRSWNSADMANLAAAAVAAGHTIEADGPITAAALANDDVFVIGEALATPTAGELTDLVGFVNGGGRLILLVESGCGGCTGATAVLTALGSTISIPGAGAVTLNPFPAGYPITDGPPYNIAGLSLTTSIGMQVLGAIDLAGDWADFQLIGSGGVVVFGDRSDHNFANDAGATMVNTQLFLNILANPLPVELVSFSVE